MITTGFVLPEDERSMNFDVDTTRGEELNPFKSISVALLPFLRG